MKKQLSHLLLLLSFAFFFLPMQAHAHFQNSKYYIKVYLSNQNVEIFRYGELIKKIPCSTGITPGTTLPGKFKTYDQKEKDVWKEADGSEINYYYITRINEKNAFHSMIEGNHPLVEEGKKLFAERKPSSMGCIRLRKIDAEWLYRLPLGIPVEVIADDKVKIRNNKISDKKHVNLKEADDSSTEYLPKSLERYLME